MTETTKIPRLDFTLPPPGYIVHPARTTSRAAAIRDQWEDYECNHDPPGVLPHPLRAAVGDNPFRWAYCTSNNSPILLTQHCASGTEARATAWDWYKRRLALQVVLDELLRVLVCAPGTTLTNVDRDALTWPRVLTWSDLDCARVEDNN